MASIASNGDPLKMNNDMYADNCVPCKRVLWNYRPKSLIETLILSLSDFTQKANEQSCLVDR